MQKLIAFAILISSCSSISQTAPRLEYRTLRPTDKPAVYRYSYKECKKRFFLFEECERKIEYFDLKDPELHRKLKDMGFVLRVEEI